MNVVLHQRPKQSVLAKSRGLPNFGSLLEALSLHGVISGGEVIVAEPFKTLALGAAWQPTFAEQDFDEQAANQYLQEVGNIGEYSNYSLAPDFFSYRRSVRNKPNSFPGPDLLPYAAWAASGPTGV